MDTMTDKEKLRALLMALILGNYHYLGDAFDAAELEMPCSLFDSWLGPREGGYIDGRSYWKPSEKGLKFLAEE